MRIELLVEPVVDQDTGGVRHRWRLVAHPEPDLMSAITYATRREAMREGEVAMERARSRGALRPPLAVRFQGR